MDRDVGTVTRLRPFYFLAQLTMAFHSGAMIFLGINFANLLFDVCADRWYTWTFWRLYGTNFGWLGVIAANFLLWHNLFGIYYWFSGITCIATAAFQIVCFATYISDKIDCGSTTFCTGCPAQSTDSTLPPESVMDWPFKVHWIFVGVSILCNLLYVVYAVYLRTRTEFAQMIMYAQQSQYNPNVTYMSAPGGYGSSLPTWMGGYGGASYPNTSMAGSSIESNVPLIQRDSVRPRNGVITSQAIAADS